MQIGGVVKRELYVDTCLGTIWGCCMVPWRPEACVMWSFLSDCLQGRFELGESIPPFNGRSGKCILRWEDCQLPSLQTVHSRCALILVLEVKSKIQFNCAAVELIQADGRRPLEGLTAQEPIFPLKAMTFGQRIVQSQLQEEEVKGLLGSG